MPCIRRLQAVRPGSQIIFPVFNISVGCQALVNSNIILRKMSNNEDAIGWTCNTHRNSSESRTKF